MILSPISKKGQVQNIAPAVLALIFASVVLIFGLIILQSLRNSNIVDQSDSASIANEVVATVDEAGEQLGCNGQRGANAFSVSAVTNNSDGLAIDDTNYSISKGGLIQYSSASHSTYNDSDWNVTYTCKHGDEAYRSGNLTVIGMGTFGDFWEIIVLAIVIGVVIGLLLVVFGGGRRAR